MIGVAFEDPFDVLEGIFRVAGLLAQSGPQHAGLDGFGRRGDRPVEVGHRPFEVPLRREHAPALEEDVGRIRGHFEGVVEVLQGVVGPLCHEQRQPAHFAGPDVVGILLDRDVEVCQGRVLIPFHHEKQPAGAADIDIPGGEFHGLVVFSPTGLGILLGEIAKHDMRLGGLQGIVAAKLDRFAGGGQGTLPVTTRQGLEAGDHHLRGGERVVSLRHLAEITQRVGPHPLPLLLRPRCPAEQSLGEHRCPVDERAGVEVVGEAPRCLVEALAKRGTDKPEHLLKIIERVGGQFGVDSRVEILLPQRLGRGVLHGRFLGLQSEGSGGEKGDRGPGQKTHPPEEEIRVPR